MKHDYRIIGMTCNGCRSSVEKALNSIQGITDATVKLPNHAEIEMDSHIATETMQTALTKAGNYSIEMIEHASNGESSATEHEKPPAKSDEPACCGGSEHPTPVLGASAVGKYHCPMHCEGDKVYDKAGDCPVCGMDLLKVPNLTAPSIQYTCPMHAEIVKDEPGSCPICGMDLVPMEPAADEEEAIYQKLLNKMKVAVLFTLPFLSSPWGK